MRARRAPAAVGLALGVLALVTGCSGVAGAGVAHAERDADGVVVTAGANDPFSLRPGDCLDEPAADRVRDVDLLPCDAEHDLQIYHSIPIEGTEYTTETVLMARAENECEAAFDAAIGISYADSALEYRSLVPSALSWRHGDRTLLCAAYDPAGPVTGTLLGSAR